jgi:acyl-CoA dehydrogenase
MQTGDFRRAYEAFIAKGKSTLCRKLTDDGRELLKWPFLEPRHRELAERLEAWAAANFAETDHHGDVDEECRRLVSVLGRDGWLKFSAPGDGENERIDVRTLALIRETLARHSGLADFAFAMQGLGAGPISLFGSLEQRNAWLPRTRTGKAIAAFALSEPESGSDVANIATAAIRDGNGFVLDGEKTGFPTAALPISMLCLREPGKHRERGGCPLSSLN